MQRKAPPSQNLRQTKNIAALEDKTSDLDALRAAVVEATTVGATLWFSYIFVLLYLFVAIGSVTHRDLFLKNAIKLPFLNIELPLLEFFVLSPLLFIITHTYVLLHLVLLSNKVTIFHNELKFQLFDRSDLSERLRGQLPSNIFVQFLAGPKEIRQGFVGVLLRLVTQISLMLGPTALLAFFLLQFLPYHHSLITYWHRIAIVIDIALLWLLWPRIAQGEAIRLQNMNTVKFW